MISFCRTTIAVARFSPAGGLYSCLLQSKTGSIRSISATSPLLFGKRYQRGKKSRKGAQDSVGYHDQLVQRKQELMKSLGHLPPEVAKSMPTGATKLPVLSNEEFSSAMTGMSTALLNDAMERLPKERASRVVADLIAIDQGELTRSELQGMFGMVAHETGAHDAKNVARLLAKEYEMYHDSLSCAMDNLSAETKAQIVLKRERLLSTEFSPYRRERAVFSELPQLEADYFKKVLDLFCRVETNIIEPSRGRSMLPTLPENGCCLFNIPFSIDSRQDIKIGDIVTFVGVRSDNTVSFMAKRLHAFEDDVAEDMNGEKLIVPKGHCWVLGDNLKESLDSRRFGAVPLVNLRSKCVGYYTTTSPQQLRWFGDMQDIIALDTQKTKK